MKHHEEYYKRMNLFGFKWVKYNDDYGHHVFSRRLDNRTTTLIVSDRDIENGTAEYYAKNVKEN